MNDTEKLLRDMKNLNVRPTEEKNEIAPESEIVPKEKIESTVPSKNLETVEKSIESVSPQKIKQRGLNPRNFRKISNLDGKQSWEKSLLDQVAFFQPMGTDYTSK